MSELRDKVVNAARELREKHPSLRYGQSLHIALERLDIELCCLLEEDPNLDCFNDNNKVQAFLSAL